MELDNYSPLIHADGQENIAVTGRGTLDGGADAAHWWPWKGNKEFNGGPAQKRDRDRLVAETAQGVAPSERRYGDGHYLRPASSNPTAAANVFIEGVTVVHAPMWVLHPLLCAQRDHPRRHRPQPWAQQRRLRPRKAAATC
jgi:polygalacturonase